MTAVELGREVERGLQRWCEEPDGSFEREDVIEMTVPMDQMVRMVKSSEIVESGIRYQRCGGGRRVIRRQKGGN